MGKMKVTPERIIDAFQSGELKPQLGCAMFFVQTEKDGSIRMVGGGNKDHIIGVAVNLIQQTGRKENNE